METMPTNPGYCGNAAENCWSPGYPTPEYVCGYSELPVQQTAAGPHQLPALSSLSLPGMYKPDCWYPADDFAQIRTGRDNYYAPGHPYLHHHSQQYHYSHHPGVSSTTIARRNERERNRVKNINSTFGKLRQHLPCSSKSRKLSKVQILRSAIQYINQLQQVLRSQDTEEQPTPDFPRAFDSVDMTSSSTASSSLRLTGEESLSPKSEVSSSHSDANAEQDFLGELADWIH